MSICLRRVFRFSAVTLCVGLYGSSVSAAPTLAEDVFPQLKGILAKAVEQSPRMLSQNLDRAAADGDMIQAKAGLYPTLGGFYQMTQTQDRREDQPGTLDSDKVFYNISLTQPVFHWGERFNNARIGDIRRQIADENFKEAYRLLAHEIRLAYLDLVMGKIQLAKVTYSRDLALEALGNAEDRLSKGVMSEGEIFAIRIAADQARLDAENALWNFDRTKRNFATLTGGAVPSDAEIPDDIPQISTAGSEIDAILSSFLREEYPDTAAARVLRNQIAVEELNYKNQRTRLRPKLNLVAGMSQDEQSYTANAGLKYGVRSQFVGLQVNWSIFDGFATKGAIRTSLARKRQAEAKYNQYSATVRSEARQLARAVELAGRQLAISERLLDNAGVFLKFTRDDHIRGNASAAQVNQAQANFNELRLSANSARYNYLMRVSDFIGRIGQTETPYMPSID
ncbi:MAG: TolC family protein [Cephaloticoccus sp.]|nr:TolC family protein [Cephaloticoccus sp.]